MRHVVVQEFLERDEAQHLQQKLDQVVQEPFEDLRTFARRFINMKDMAYPQNELDVPSVRNRLISLFLGGIYNDSVRQQASRGRANKTLNDIMRDAFDIEGSFETCRRTTGRPAQPTSSMARQEEPMDISAVIATNVGAQLDKAVDRIEQKFKSVQGEMKALRNKGPCQPDVPIAAVKGETVAAAEVQPRQPHQQQQPATPAQSGQQQMPMAPWFYPMPMGVQGMGSMNMQGMMPGYPWQQMMYAQQQPMQQQVMPQQHMPMQPMQSMQPMQQPMQPMQQQQPMQQPPQRNSYGQTRPPRSCYECGEPGHFARGCPKKMDQIVAAVDAAFTKRLTPNNQGN